MKTYTDTRKFRRVAHEEYPNAVDSDLLAESSMIGDCPDSFDCPGSSYLWIGKNHHLNRNEVEQMIQRMQYWLNYKRLPTEAELMHEMRFGG